MAETINKFLGTRYTTALGTTEVNLFDGTTGGATYRRTGVLVHNMHASNTIYVGDATGISSTAHWYQIAPGDTYLVPFSENVSFFAIASGASTTWRAQQVVIEDRGD